MSKYDEWESAPAVRQMEEHCSVMEEAAGEYGNGSPEKLSIKRAAFALIFTVEDHNDEFAAFVSDIAQPGVVGGSNEPTLLQMTQQYSVLNSVANKYTNQPLKRNAIEYATLALKFVNLRYEEAFSEYVSKFERLISQEEMGELERRFGNCD